MSAQFRPEGGRQQPPSQPQGQTQPPDEDPRDEQIRKMQAQLEGLTILVQRVLASDDQGAALSQADVEKKAPPLESVVDERARILAAWDAEERVMISIAPDVNDQKAREAMQAQAKRAGQDPEGVGFPPRIFQVNGVQLAIPVGELTRVPLSIARMYEYMLNPWKARGVTPPITFDQAEARLGLAA